MGKVKVLNVTEARKNFATVLGDEENHYIITKNNKPIRVMITYDEYEHFHNLKEVAENQPQHEDVQDQFEHKQEAEEDSKPVKESKNRVPGILRQNIDLVKQVSEKPKKSVQKVEKPSFDFDAFMERQRQKNEGDELGSEPSLKDEQSTDIEASRQTLEAASDFSNENQSIEDENYFLMAPDEDEDELIGDALEEIEAQKIEEALAKAFEVEDDEDAMEQGAASIEERPYAPTAQVEDRQEKSQEIQIDDVVIQTKEDVQNEKSAEPTRTTEEEEYYKKYKKLYDSFGMGQPSVEQETDDEIQRRLKEKYAQLFAGDEIQEPTPQLGNQTTTNDLPYEDDRPLQSSELELNNESENVSENLELEAPSFSPREKGAPVSEPIIDDSEEMANYFETADDDGSPQGLPSLKDLLQDLEKEHLTDYDDEEDLNDGEIDDLIARITQD